MGRGRSPLRSDGPDRGDARERERRDGQYAHERVEARAGRSHTNLLTSATRLTRLATVVPPPVHESRGFASQGHPWFALVGQPRGWGGSRRLRPPYVLAGTLCTFQAVPSVPRTLGPRTTDMGRTSRASARHAWGRSATCSPGGSARSPRPAPHETRRRPRDDVPRHRPPRARAGSIPVAFAARRRGRPRDPRPHPPHRLRRPLPAGHD